MRFVLLAAAALFVMLWALPTGGCGVIGGGSKPTPTPSPTPTATPTPTPTATPTPIPMLDTPALEALQGGYAVVRVSAAAASATATFEGEEYPLMPGGDGFWGVIGVGADHATGSYAVAVSLRDASGSQFAAFDAELTVYAAGYPVEAIYLAPEESELLDPSLSAQEEAIRSQVFATFTPERLWSGAFILPSAGPISSPYGIGRSYNGGPVSGFHHGTDFGADEGDPVVAANAGRVAYAAPLPVRGNSVIIDHGGGVFSGYHHLVSIAVRDGQTVKAGDLIGYVGATGLATGPHLHWEIVVHGVAVDPVLWTYDEIGP
jgi:murein DD-endopeptidase MepM/ murein hydrolase activator NlpD